LGTGGAFQALPCHGPLLPAEWKLWRRHVTDREGQVDRGGKGLGLAMGIGTLVDIIAGSGMAMGTEGRLGRATGLRKGEAGERWLVGKTNSTILDPFSALCLSRQP